MLEQTHGFTSFTFSFLRLKYEKPLCVLSPANFNQSPWENGDLESVKETLLIVKTNTVQPALCSAWVKVDTTAACSISLSNTGRPWREKHHELVSVEKERTLGIINSNRPMTVNREEPVWAAFYFNHPPIRPTTSHFPPPKHLMKYVQGKQRWSWCADLPPLWLTATCPVPLLIYKACRVSARVASLVSLHAIRALS